MQDFFDEIDDAPLVERVELPGKGGKTLVYFAVSPPQRDLEHIKMLTAKRGKDLDDGEWDPESAALMAVACMHHGPSNDAPLVFKESDIGRLINMHANIIEPMADAAERVCRRDFESRRAAKKNSVKPSGAPST